MRFVRVSYVTEDDLAAAKTSVRNQEAAEFADFLATRWQPWDTLVSRIAPEAYAAKAGWARSWRADWRNGWLIISRPATPTRPSEPESATKLSARSRVSSCRRCSQSVRLR
ncbi:hypothetical protein H8A97_30210 [Bradyrhizobium sp. Arg62]|uniref:NEL-type E3 ubiquitin ligase domain-containing protein n=1 Tax=Bradyrhizobium TaxID=374 RepID=UPI001E40AE7C|nr:NEL-type E3 ubiquitin ligase domain-containing protein [Bradyrhizobium ivorense]MCC8943365.1 hypothetical protein [Bradyrhizobium ivorense]MCC8949264.1 hypothetical protein [Bradyrhizobium brasilense]